MTYYAIYALKRKRTRRDVRGGRFVIPARARASHCEGGTDG